MILVTGATGQIGSIVLDHLLGENVQVRAFVRDESKLENKNHPKLKTAVGTFEDRESLKRAMTGVDKLFLVARDNPDQVEQHRNVIEVAEEAGVEHIVKLSAFTASKDSPVSLMRWHAETEEILRNSSLDWTFIRPHLYMQNILRSGKSVAEEDFLSAPMSDDAFALIDIRDIAEVAAHVLNSEGHASKVYTLTGPDTTTYTEVAEILSELLDKTVDYKYVSQKSFYNHLIEGGRPSWRAYDLAHIADAYSEGRNITVTNDINKLIGRNARSIREFLTDHLSKFK